MILSDLITNASVVAQVITTVAIVIVWLEFKSMSLENPSYTLTAAFISYIFTFTVSLIGFVTVGPCPNLVEKYPLLIVVAGYVVGKLVARLILWIYRLHNMFKTERRDWDDL